MNDDPAAFYDCMAMWPGGKRGLAMSDPVDGKFRVIETSDGGATWSVVDPAGMPDAVEGEAGFAASGTCLVTAGRHDAYLASGGAASRIFHSGDGGHTWTVADSTIPAAEAGGVFSLPPAMPRQVLAVGGDFTAADNGVDMSAYSHDRGRSWTNGGDLGGYRSGVDWLSRTERPRWRWGRRAATSATTAAGTGRAFDDAAYDAVQCPADGSCWASGPAGAVARLGR